MGRASWVLLVVILVPAMLPFAAAESPEERRLVSFEGAAPPSGSLLSGVRVLEAFPFARVALVEGAPADLAVLSALPDVAGVYEEEALSFSMERVRGLVHADPPAPGAWPRGRHVTVALVDSGLDDSHPDLAGRVLDSVRVTSGGAIATSAGDDEGHGTHVAGILGGSGAASAGRLRGIAPAAPLVAVDISDAFTTTSAVRAFQWIHEHREALDIRVVTNSWGREKRDAHYDADDPVIRASDALVADGMVVVFSAGNRGRDGASTLTTEASNPNVLSVGSASGQGRREPYSSRGPVVGGDGAGLSWVKPDLVAPGSQVTSTASGGGYIVMNGTSMAAPQVAAAAALLLDAHPELPPHTVAAILKGTARDLGATGPDDDTGHGMLDVAAAIEAARLMSEGDKRVVTETLVPVRLAGSVVAAAGHVLAAGGSLKVPPGETVTLPILIPQGARKIDLWFNWSGAGEFDVSLRGRGEERLFEPVGDALRFAGEVQPGTHSVVVRPRGVADQTSFTVQGAILVVEERVVEVPRSLAGRPFIAQGGFYFERDATARAIEVMGKAPILAFALCGLVGAGFGLKLRRR